MAGVWLATQADDELLMAIPPRFLPKVIEGLAALDRNGT